MNKHCRAPLPCSTSEHRVCSHYWSNLTFSPIFIFFYAMGTCFFCVPMLHFPPRKWCASVLYDLAAFSAVGTWSSIFKSISCSGPSRFKRDQMPHFPPSKWSTSPWYTSSTQNNVLNAFANLTLETIFSSSMSFRTLQHF